MDKDYQELTNLIYSYAEILDTGDHEGLGRMFEHGEVCCFYDGPGGSGEPNVGYTAVKNFYDNMVQMHDGGPRTRHVITNLIIEWGDDRETAKSRAYFQVVQEAPGLPLQIVVSGRYHDSYQKIDGKWKFKQKLIKSDYFGDVTKHSKYHG